MVFQQCLHNESPFKQGGIQRPPGGILNAARRGLWRWPALPRRPPKDCGFPRSLSHLLCRSLLCVLNLESLTLRPSPATPQDSLFWPVYAQVQQVKVPPTLTPPHPTPQQEPRGQQRFYPEPTSAASRLFCPFVLVNTSRYDSVRR